MRISVLFACIALLVACTAAQNPYATDVRNSAAHEEAEGPQMVVYYVVDLYVNYVDVLLSQLLFASLEEQQAQARPVREAALDGYEPAPLAISDSDCNDLPERMKVDCLNAAVGDLYARMAALEQDMQQLVQAEINFVQYFLAVSMFSLVVLLTVLLAISCCCDKKRKKRRKQKKQQQQQAVEMAAAPFDPQTAQFAAVMYAPPLEAVSAKSL
mmetsp:Transcript_4622/g.16276  ORF Transcript_4622/g.16276 Transcript_4622/m.16276 type:complete len:213 (+) Transcript_4622:66-704(+)|eukprot:CAMPEP_0114612246 /NCGR_PEP_ID=MMETSP0168-20121206/4524_1 /TAXON_ID=95228 ORGANISM="Vannella sp., Strain DIVA3 517/6/12" /NCGR_SAMPLE_ID=MMETSP0168 /ASSEMBLY_ACC=CAM_ASM_000044 /LENGTH=212 /DNA_ID=CAMNT_0001823227 /DNA_START=30 /DNA_END=668 /DNA_ORIENTATION=+